jgi:hypothetical protein
MLNIVSQFAFCLVHFFIKLIWNSKKITLGICNSRGNSANTNTIQSENMFLKSMVCRTVTISGEHIQVYVGTDVFATPEKLTASGNVWRPSV